MKNLIISSFLLITINLFAQELKPFETDGCTLFIDGPKDRPKLWQHCCLMHDMKYWYGGSHADQDKADLALKACVLTVSDEYWSNLIYLGVRAGHMSPVKNKYRWSWGWNPSRSEKYSELSSSEKDIAVFELKKLSFDSKYISQVLKESF